MGVNALESFMSSGGVIESLGAVEISGAEGNFGGYPGVVMLFLVILF